MPPTGHKLAGVFVLLASRVAFATTVADICPATADPCVVSSAEAVTPGSTLDFGSRALDVQNKGKLVVPSGLMTILAGSVRVESGGDLLGSTSSDTGASIKVMTSGDIRVETGGNGAGTVDVSASLNPGEIDLLAHGNVVIDGQVNSNASNTQGSGGVINVTADGNVSVMGAIRAFAGTLGLGGSVTVMAGGTLTQSGSVRADGGDGGDVELDALNGDVISTDVNASAGGTFGDGGCITVIASRNATVNGNYLMPAAGSTSQGGGDGGLGDIEGTAGTVTINGTVDAHGAAPDGDGGEVDITAGLDYAQPGSVLVQGNGTDSCGGFFCGLIGRNFNQTGGMDVSGGFCGGDAAVMAGAASLGSSGEINADAGSSAGTSEIDAQQITVAGKLHATGTASTNTAGVISLTGCTMSVPSGGSIKTDGTSGENLLQASGKLTVGGTLSSRPTGKNRFEYLSTPPTILGSAIIQPAQDCAPATGCMNPSLAACAASAVCGNGVIEAGETCDDGNTLACDGCSPTCQTEGCGNGVIECGEECDDGASNGAPGDPCDATCHAVQGGNTLFIPAARHGFTGCMLEWALQTEPVAGFPAKSQTCIDGDPACDQDGTTDGVCTFDVRACLNVTDVRLPHCGGHFVADLNARRPSPTRPVDQTEADNAQSFVTALETLGPTVRSGDTTLHQGTPTSTRDHCSPTFVVRVPHAEGAVGRRLLSATSTASVGRASNRIALACAPNPSVCGNGVVEVTEQCDDGNTVSCDGCSSTCKIERCGNRVVDCHEQCDDGALNGQAGDPCSARCTENPPPDRIPGGSSAHDCVQEWALATSALATAHNGLPSTKQTCVDNDPSCDFDPTPGSCRFHLWSCVGGDDTRLGCAASTVASVSLVRPSVKQTGSAAVARQALLGAFGRLPLPTPGTGEVCSERIDLDVPAGKAKLVVSADATTADGVRDRDTLKLTCAPAGP
jgi:cysteine-rich repeat protein